MFLTKSARGGGYVSLTPPPPYVTAVDAPDPTPYLNFLFHFRRTYTINSVGKIYDGELGQNINSKVEFPRFEKKWSRNILSIWKNFHKHDFCKIYLFVIGISYLKIHQVFHHKLKNFAKVKWKIFESPITRK